MVDDMDPVRAALAGEVDLYDVATWEVRSLLDVFATWVYLVLARVKRWVVVIVALSLFFGQMAVVAPLVAEQPLIGVLATLSVVPALLLVGYLWYVDPTSREPLEPLAVTFLLGVLFAAVAGVLNSLFLPFFAALPAVGFVLFFFLVAAPVEETVKWLAVRVFAYDAPSFDAVIDGVVYGAMAGLGFAAIENLSYIAQTSLLATGGGFPPLEYTVETATQRAFVGPGHVIYSAFAGYYLGLAKFNPGKRGPIIVKGLVIAAFIHGLYNSLVSVLPLTALGFVGFVVVYDALWLGVLYRKLRRYERLYGIAQNRMSLRSRRL